MCLSEIVFSLGHLVPMVVTETDLQSVSMKLPPLQVTLFPKNDSNYLTVWLGLSWLEMVLKNYSGCAHWDFGAEGLILGGNQ